jgi:hypothetical protein
MIRLAIAPEEMSNQDESYTDKQLEKWEIENHAPYGDYVQFLEEENEELKKEIDKLKGKNKRKRFSNENEINKRINKYDPLNPSNDKRDFKIPQNN